KAGDLAQISGDVEPFPHKLAHHSPRPDKSRVERASSRRQGGFPKRLGYSGMSVTRPGNVLATGGKVHRGGGLSNANVPLRS
ncbi:MAG TPA: hypothetical protein VLJ79_13160, partial [Candidatus Binatia bacterium]|nr:hypothetical protein [Candidatus Binatia bacterium]